LNNLIEQCPETLQVAIVGGGAAGVELAGNIHRFIRAKNIQSDLVLITRGSRLLSQFPSSAGSKVFKTFQKRGVQILLNSEVSTINDQTIVLANQEEIPFDLCISAIGILPNAIESQKALKTTSQGDLIVNKYLQCKDHSNIFAAGDCICFESHPLWKSGYHAINQGPILLHNILALANNSPLSPYKPKSYIYTALNLGDGTGIAIVGRFTYHGKIAFKIKDYIERRFLRLHQC
jgi:NADH dehydrogenase FAD-containing subunit